jgi:anti-anti-sigma factor
MRLSARCWQSAATEEGRAVSPSAKDATAGADNRTEILRVHGELDLATAGSLCRRAGAAIGRRARLLLLDLTGVSFCDACGLNAFVRIANEAEAAGCRYGLIAPQPPVAKLLRLTGLNQRLHVFATIDLARQRLMAPAGRPRNP